MKKAYKYLVLMVLCFIFIALNNHQITKNDDSDLKLYLLNVGQGDAIYIKTPTSKRMLIDAGRDRSVLGEIGKIENNIEKIDIVEISNPDLDHIGGIPFVMEKYKIGSILSPGSNHTTSAYKEIERLSELNKINILKPKQGQVIILDQESMVTYTILWPEGNTANWERNSGSMVGLLEYAGKKVLLTGDAPKEVEDEILKKYGKYLQNIDILKAGHHGSNTSTGERLVQNTLPKYALISAGLNNRYGHPHQEVLDVLQKYKTNTLTTIENGAIECIISKSKETICK